MKKKEMIRSESNSGSIFLKHKWSITGKKTHHVCILKSSGLWHSSLYLSLALLLPATFASANTEQPSSVKSKISQIWQPKPDDQANTIKIDDFNRLFTNTSSVQELPKISAAATTGMPSHSVRSVAVGKRSQLDFLDAIRQALQRRPEITQGIAEVAQQQANIDTVKSQYFPQISGGFNTGDFTTGERGRQVFSISATQMLYDFGKIKSAVTVEQAKLMQDQAQLLLEIDDISYQVANAIVNIKRYEELVKIADQQISGIGRIAEIARLRAQAGISSQADPIQAQSNLEAAQSTKVVQEAQLHQYQQKLRTLLGYDVSNVNINMPSFLVEKAGLYDEIDFNNVSKMMAAQTAVQIEARISPRDIAFIRPDQEALVKVTAYDYSIYGGLHGKVTVISPDTIRDEVKQDQFYYRAYIRTDSDKLINKQGKQFNITPGMVAVVDIKTGHKTVLDYLIKPFNKAKEALRER